MNRPKNRKCSLNGCNYKHYGLGYCRKHYRQVKKYGKIINFNLRCGNQYIDKGDHYELLCFSKFGDINAVALIDKDDLERCKQHKWFLRSSDEERKYFATVPSKRAGGHMLTLHRFIIGNPPDGMEIDHKNRIKIDCRKDNLRFCTKSENANNRIRLVSRKSKYKGVIVQKGYIRAMYANKYLGSFSSQIEAAKAYNQAAIEAVGEFAILNDIE